MTDYLYTVPYKRRTEDGKRGLIIYGMDKDDAYRKAQIENPTDRGLVRSKVRRSTAEDIATSDINLDGYSADYETPINTMISTEDGAVYLGE